MGDRLDGIIIVLVDLLGIDGEDGHAVTSRPNLRYVDLLIGISDFVECTAFPFARQ